MVAVEPQGHISLVCDVPAVALQRCVITALKIQSMILVKGCKYLPTANQIANQITPLSSVLLKQHC